MTAASVWTSVKSYFNVAGDLESQPQIEASIRSGVSFRGAQLLVLIFAIFVASLGLNTDSIPVIIGAMLISPLMGPIIGMGLGIGIHDFDLLRRGMKNIFMAVVGSLAASAVYFLISPQYEGSSQLLARTSPSIYDVFIALFGGAAGIVSIAAKNKGQVMPGVAIATSLMPPLCTAGYGLATLQWQFFFGALYLFFTNMVFILFATWTGVKLMGLRPLPAQDTARARRIQVLVYTIVIATVGVSAYLTAIMLQKSIFMERAAQFVQTEMVVPNTQVLSHREYVERGVRHIDVTLIGDPLPKDSLQLAMTRRLDEAGLGGTRLNIHQGFSIERAQPGPVTNNEEASRMYAIMQSQLAARQNTVDSLSRIIDGQRRVTDAAVRLSPEVRVVFPGVSAMAMTHTVASDVSGDIPSDTVYLLMVNAPRGLAAAERKRLADYAAVRLNLPAVDICVNPPAFPWPEAKTEEAAP